MDRKLNYKIGGILSITVVAAIVGTLAFTSLETNSDSNTNTQSIGIGAFVTVEVFDKDGNLDHTWEGHNRLGDLVRGFMAACLSGVAELVCSGIIHEINPDTVILFLGDPGQQATDEVTADSTNVTMVPEDCLTDASNFLNCTGWTVVGTFDVPPGPACTEGVDCKELRDIGTKSDSFPEQGIFYNTIVLQPIIIIEPGDRVIVTMNFEIPL